MASENFIEVYDKENGFSRLYTKDNKLVLLISQDMWSSGLEEPLNSKLLLDSKIILFFLEHYGDKKVSERRDEPMKSFLKGMLEFEDEEKLCEILDGLQKLRLGFVQKGETFQVQHDGFKECIKIYREKFWKVA